MQDNKLKIIIAVIGWIVTLIAAFIGGQQSTVDFGPTIDKYTAKIAVLEDSIKEKDLSIADLTANNESLKNSCKLSGNGWKYIKEAIEGPYEKKGFDDEVFQIEGESRYNGYRIGYSDSIAKFKLNDKYSQISFDIARIDGDRNYSDEMILYVMSEGNVIKEIKVNADTGIQHFDINVLGVKILEMKAEFSKTYGSVGIFDIKLYQ